MKPSWLVVTATVLAFIAGLLFAEARHQRDYIGRLEACERHEGLAYFDDSETRCRDGSVHKP